MVCAAKQPAQHVPPVAARETATASPHARAGIVQVRGRPVPSQRRRAPSTSWERNKSAIFCCGAPVAGCIYGCSHSGELARHVLAHVMNSVAKRAVEGEWRWALTAKVFVQGHANPNARTLAFCQIIGCRGNVRTVGKINLWHVAQVLKCPPSRSALSARRIARFA
jgi:hypothetical protein